MRGRPLAFAALTAALVWSAAATPSAAEVRTVAVRGQRVLPDGALRLFVALRTGEGALEPAPEPARFVVERDGVPLEGAPTVVPFAGSGEGTAAVVAIDVSGTMKRAWPKIRESVAGFARALRPGLDRTAVGTIGDAWQLVLDFSGDPQLVTRTVEGLSGDSKTTALFESIYLATQLLAGHGAELPARRYLIVVSDGFNEKRGRTADECIALARAASVQVNSLIFLDRPTEALLSAKGELEKISVDTGGLTVTTSDPDDLPEAMARLHHERLGECVVTIPASAASNDGREHEVVLRYEAGADHVRYQAPLVAAAPTPPPSPSPAPAPKAPAAGAGAPPPWLAIGLAAGGLALVGAAVWLWRRRARAHSTAAAAAQHAEAAAREAELARVQREKAATSAKTRAETERMAARPGVPAPRKTEYRPPTAGPGAEVHGLRVVRGAQGVSFLSFPPAGGRIGYDPTNEIVLKAESVSGAHAQVVAVPGGLAICDLGSTNGTFVDGARVGAQPVTLRAGSQVRLGLVVLVCE